MTVIICDDEIVYLNTLKETVTSWVMTHELENAIAVYCFSSTEDLLTAWKAGLAINVLFLDIQLPGEMSGIELAKVIREKDDQATIVFITNYSEYACDGYYVNALRYIQKPVHNSNIYECLDIAYRQWQLSQSESLILKLKKQTYVLPFRDIIYIEAFAHYLAINRTSKPPLQIRSTIPALYKELPKALFVQCHRGFIVNISYIRFMTKNAITLVGNHTIPIGSKYTDQVFSMFRQFYQEA